MCVRAEVPTVHGLSLYGKPDLPENFRHYPYVNPDAPKGGTLVNAASGTFDSTNPMIITGKSAAGIGALGRSMVYDTLLTDAPDESFSAYGLLACGIRLDPSRRWVEFDINPAARFSDGYPVTAQDVKFSFELLRDRGSPFYRTYYADVISVTLPKPNTIRFGLAPRNSRELPLILGQFPVLPQHIWRHRDFSRPTLDLPIGSGPYRVASVTPGSRIIYQRNKDYWARDLPVNRGRYNPDRVIYDYYRDDSVALEAFLAGHIDYRVESSASHWAKDYRGPAVQSGAIRRFTLPNGSPAPMVAWVVNLRRPLFQNQPLRKALNLAFDFATLNRLFFYGSYRQTFGFFDESEMAATGLPEGEEKALLRSLGELVPPAVLTTPLQNDAITDGHQRLVLALSILRKAGYTLRGEQLLSPEGRPVNFEFLLTDAAMARLVIPYVKNLSRIGIHVALKQVDSVQYQARVRRHDFDMVYDAISQSNSPGNEQRYYWDSQYADLPQSNNTAGIKNPAIDKIVDYLIHADSRAQLVASTRALDRLLRFNDYVVPLYHSTGINIAMWQKIKMPKRSPRYGFDMTTLWIGSEHKI